MACSGCALVARLLQFRFGKIKRGPRGPMRTVRIWMASAIPGGAPGYDDDKQFGNFITHMAARTSQRLRGYTCQTPNVKGKAAMPRFWDFSEVPGVPRERKCGFQPCAPFSSLVMAGLNTRPGHPRLCLSEKARRGCPAQRCTRPGMTA